MGRPNVLARLVRPACSVCGGRIFWLTRDEAVRSMPARVESLEEMSGEPVVDVWVCCSSLCDEVGGFGSWTS